MCVDYRNIVDRKKARTHEALRYSNVTLRTHHARRYAVASCPRRMGIFEKVYAPEYPYLSSRYRYYGNYILRTDTLRFLRVYPLRQGVQNDCVQWRAVNTERVYILLLYPWWLRISAAPDSQGSNRVARVVTETVGKARAAATTRTEEYIRQPELDFDYNRGNLTKTYGNSW